ncbi:MAG: trypsin-like peptidase domain-containing protein [Fimbriimonadaceae bacterium]
MPNFKTLATNPISWGVASCLVIGGVALAATLQQGNLRVPAADALFQSPAPVMQPVSTLNEQSMSVLRDLDQATANLAEYMTPSVVHIRANRGTERGQGGMLEGPRGSQGTGVIYREDGWIITNAHVVDGFSNVTVVTSDGREFQGRVTASDDTTLDLAVVKIDATGLKPARFADSRTVRPGQIAMAIGSPFGFENSVTLGHVSALGRQNVAGDMMGANQRFYSDLIQTDTPINMGNSGGPLINVNGEVIGINSAIFSVSGGNQGIGFAIPSNLARFVSDLLIQNGKITRSYLGLIPESLKPYEQSKLNLQGGARVVQVEPNTPSARAGIQADDIIVRIGDQQVVDQQDVRNSMLKFPPNSEVDVELLRNNQRITVKARLSEVPRDLAQNRGPQRVQPGNPGSDGMLEQIPPQFRDQFRDFFRDQAPEGRQDNRRQGENVERPRLGVSLQNLDETIRNQRSIPGNVNGAYVNAVVPDSIAANIGIEVGDVIVRVGDTEIRSAQDLVNRIGSLRVGETVMVTFVRYTEQGVETFTKSVRL